MILQDEEAADRFDAIVDELMEEASLHSEALAEIISKQGKPESGLHTYYTHVLSVIDECLYSLCEETANRQMEDEAQAEGDYLAERAEDERPDFPDDY